MRSAKTTLGLTTVLLSSCALLSPEDPLDHLLFDAEASVDTGVVRFSLFVTNDAREEVVLTAGGCQGDGVALLVYDREGHLVWDPRPPEPLPADYICPMYLITYRIPGGEGIRIDGSARVARILERGLPEGRYRLVVKPMFGSDLTDSDIPVGEFTLELESG